MTHLFTFCFASFISASKKFAFITQSSSLYRRLDLSSVILFVSAIRPKGILSLFRDTQRHGGRYLLSSHLYIRYIRSRYFVNNSFVYDISE